MGGLSDFCKKLGMRRVLRQKWLLAPLRKDYFAIFYAIMQVEVTREVTSVGACTGVGNVEKLPAGNFGAEYEDSKIGGFW